MNDEGLSDVGAANPFRLPRLHPGSRFAWRPTPYHTYPTARCVRVRLVSAEHVALYTMILRPVVNNATDHIRVTVGRDRLKEVPADDLAAFDDIRGTERFGTGDDIGETVEHPRVF